jgi:hypothetical protein
MQGRRHEAELRRVMACRRSGGGVLAKKKKKKKKKKKIFSLWNVYLFGGQTHNYDFH